MNTIYIFIATILALVIGATFQVEWIAMLLAVVLGYYGMNSYYTYFKLHTGLAAASLPDEFLGDAALIGLIYAVGVIALIMYPDFHTLNVIGYILLPWIVHIILINTFTILYLKGIIQVGEPEDDDEDSY